MESKENVQIRDLSLMSVNFVLQRISDRLDKIEGVRGTATIESDLNMTNNLINNALNIPGQDLNTEDSPEFTGLTISSDLNVTGNSFTTDIDIDGALNHDGTTVGLYGTTPVTQGAALTATDTSITHTAPGTPDFAIQDLINTTPFGFVTKDEGNTVLQVILNLQTRINELEARLDTSTGIGVFT